MVILKEPLLTKGTFVRPGARPKPATETALSRQSDAQSEQPKASAAEQ